MRTASSGFPNKIQYRKLSALLFCLLALLLFAGCAADAGTSAYSVTIVDSVFFTAENAAGTAAAGEDYTAHLFMLSGYEPVSCDYAGEYRFEETGEGEYDLILCSVVNPSRVTVTSSAGEKSYTENEEKTCSVTYVYNDDAGTSKTVDYTLSYHLRANTDIAEDAERDGYTLIGWNTEEDGTGEHIGLGSRVSVSDGESLTLYGEWKVWEDESVFVTSAQSDGTVYLTGYRGDGDSDEFVIPEKINGKTVSGISNSFTTNMRCGSITSKTLVLPRTVLTVADGAFRKSSFEEVYFFDNLESITGKAFQYGITTYHVNAAQAPCLQDANYNTRFADNIDVLIENQGSKKMVFFSGCSFTYGLNSETVTEAFDGEYAVVNAGVNGDFNALFQMEIILTYLEEGDVFVHAPEQASTYQFLSSMILDGRAFAMTEGNYDLLALADFSYSTTVFDAYGMYNNLRDGQETCSYDDDIGMFNRYGDCITDRPYDESTELERDVAYSPVYGYDTDLLTEENVAALAEIYGRIENAGAKVYVSCAPVNRNCSQEEEIDAKAEEFQTLFENLLSPYGYPLISENADYLYSGRYFYDEDYHLNDLGVVYRTAQLIADLKAAGLGGGK